ncbi:restriction endonuclease subunit S [Enterococcus asini]|uniref:restriction endonuclease subunit S n=1 Tax=Enterococcus asini TaxID=57732 RepID=UPI00289320DC|nr:restriction endonuclease subunit S [Enterococcus asini]
MKIKRFQDWEQRKLGDYTDLITKGTTPKDKANIGEVTFVKVENISGGKINSNSRISIDEHENYLKRSKLKESDILFSIAGTLGRTAVVDKSILPANTNQALSIIRGYKFDTDFLLTSLNGKVVNDFIRKNPTIGAQPNLSLEQVGNLIVWTPSKDEQQHIGNFFRKLESTITLHQQKYDHLIQLKKAYLDLMFPKIGECTPKVRFVDFHDNWEQRKLQESIKVMDGDRGSNYPHDSDFFENGDTLFLDTGNVTKNGFKFDSVKYITKEKDEQLRAGKLEKNDFVLTSRGTLGNVGFYDESVYKLHPKLRINSAMLILRNTDNQLSYSYLHTLLKGKLISDFMRKNQVGSAQPHITKSEFLKLDLNVPCDTEEQNKVGEFFKNLDQTITLHQQKIASLKSLKQAYLQKMFV